MALGLREIDDWDGAALEEFSHQLRRRSRTLEDLGESVKDAGRIPEWMGLGADAAQVSFAQLAGEISDRAATVGAVKELVASLIDQVKALKNALDDARDHAARFGLVLTDEGAVIDGPAVGASEPAAQAAREAARAEIAARVQAILTTAADVEADTTAILTTAARGGFIGDGMSVEDASEKGQLDADRMFQAPPPPDDLGAQQHYLETLSPEQRAELLRENPHWLANAYGIDPAVREKAARLWLPQLRREFAEEKEFLEERLQAIRDSPLDRPPGLVGDLERQIDVLDTKLTDLDRISALTSDDPNTHLLGLRPHDYGVGAVVAQGDIADADHVTVRVPGMGTETVGNPEAGNNLAGELEKMGYLQSEMHHHLAATVGPGEDVPPVATVSYLNMDFPDGLPDAARSSYADAAAPDLADMLNGIKATSAEGNNLTLLGHSYGSLTASEALQAGGAADNVVFFGSPGLESSGEGFDADSLGVPEENRYVMMAGREIIEPVALSGRYGGAPQYDAGLTRLDTGHHETLRDGSPVPGDRELGPSLGHSQYDSGPNTTSLWNIAAIATGAPENAIPFDQSSHNEQHYLVQPYSTPWLPLGVSVPKMFG